MADSQKENPKVEKEKKKPKKSNIDKHPPLDGASSDSKTHPPKVGEGAADINHPPKVGEGSEKMDDQPPDGLESEYVYDEYEEHDPERQAYEDEEELQCLKEAVLRTLPLAQRQPYLPSVGGGYKRKRAVAPPRPGEGSSDSDSDSDTESSSSSSDDSSPSKKKKRKKSKKRKTSKKSSKKKVKKPKLVLQNAAELNQWSVRESTAYHINYHSKVSYNAKLLQEDVFDKMPVPDNIEQVPDLDKKVVLALSSRGHDITKHRDDNFKSIQTLIRGALGPLLKARELIKSKPARELLDFGTLALGQAMCQTNYLRRLTVSMNLLGPKCAKELLRQSTDLFKIVDNPNLFGDEF